MTDLVGRKLGRYQVVSLLGAGGMGTVFRARDSELERDVALKVLPEAASEDPTRLERFAREARAVARLSHPNILEIHDVGHDNGVHYAVTELLEGETLRERLKRGRLPVRKAVAIADAISRGLGAAHAQGVIHRDVKPENVLLTSDGRVKVLDFGIASLHEPEASALGSDEATEISTITATGSLIGTVGYMSPEQVRGQPVDARSDVFALGCLLYEMLTVQQTFKRPSPAETLAAVLQDDPDPPGSLVPEIPPGVDRVVMRCLEKEPAERFQSAADVAFALRAAEGSRGHRTVSGREPTWRSNRRLVASAILGATVVIAAGLAWRYVEFGPLNLPDRKHISVTRFQAEGENRDAQVFAAGLSEQLAEQLRLLEEQTQGALWVLPVGDKGVHGSDQLPKDARVYAVTVGLTGSYRRSDHQVELELSAVDPTTGRTLRSAEISDRAGNIAALQSAPVLEVARMLGVDVAAETRQRLQGNTSNVSGAFEALVKGTGWLLVGTEESELDRAMDELRNAVALDPALVPAHVALARALLRKFESTKDAQWLQAGLAEGRQAVALRRVSSPAYVVIAALYRAAGKDDDAVATLEDAVKLCPADADAHLELGRLYQKLHRFDDAETQLQLAVYRRPGYWPGYHYLALLHLARGETEAAATEFRHVVEAAPLNHKGYNNLAYVYDQLGRKGESLAALERSVELEPEDNPVAFVNLGKLYFDDARFADAAALFERACGLRPDNYHTWGNLAYSYASGVDPTRIEEAARSAIALAEAALEERPDDPALLCHLAGYHALVGEREKGIELLERAIQADPQDSKIIGNIAGTWEDLGDRDHALEWVERAFAAGVLPSRFENRPLLRGLVADERYRRLVERK